MFLGLSKSTGRFNVRCLSTRVLNYNKVRARVISRHGVLSVLTFENASYDDPGYTTKTRIRVRTGHRVHHMISRVP